MIVDFDLFKKHVRADDFADDDAYLAYLLAAAETAVVKATRRTPVELYRLGGQDCFPLPLVQAIMMLAAHWYNQRESASAVQMNEVPGAVSALVKPYTKLER